MNEGMRWTSHIRPTFVILNPYNSCRHDAIEFIPNFILSYIFNLFWWLKSRWGIWCLIQACLSRRPFRWMGDSLCRRADARGLSYFCRLWNISWVNVTPWNSQSNFLLIFRPGEGLYAWTTRVCDILKILEAGYEFKGYSGQLLENNWGYTTPVNG